MTQKENPISHKAFSNDVKQELHITCRAEQANQAMPEQVVLALAGKCCRVAR